MDALKGIGAWMKVNGESIYGTKASPLAALPWGPLHQKRAQRQYHLYLSVFNWPADGKLLVPV